MTIKLQSNDLDAIVLASQTPRQLLLQVMLQNWGMAQHALQQRDPGPHATWGCVVDVELDVPLKLAQEVAREAMRIAHQGGQQHKVGA